MNEYYIHLSSVIKNDMKIRCFLPFPIELTDSEWEIALLDIAYGKKKTDFPSINICYDKIVPSIFNGKTLPILRFIPKVRNFYTSDFTKLNYFHILCDTLYDIELYIKIADEETNSFLNETVSCTLHMRKIQDEVRTKN